MQEVFTGMLACELDTPALTIDLDIAHRNINRLQEYLGGHGIANRPHAKTHKLPPLAHAQLAAGAVGITCQKLGEAEVMANAGISDILVCANLIGPEKRRRVAELGQRVRLAGTTDNQVVAEEMSQAAQLGCFELPLLIECDTGLGRCGVQSPSAAVELAQFVAGRPGLRFAGVLTYPISAKAAIFTREAVRALTSAGLPPEVVSSGGTPGVFSLHKAGVFNEHRAGEYVFNDRYLLSIGEARIEDCSLRVLATVVSRPTPDRVVLDLGSKYSVPSRASGSFRLRLHHRVSRLADQETHRRARDRRRLRLRHHARDRREGHDHSEPWQRRREPV